MFLFEGSPLHAIREAQLIINANTLTVTFLISLGCYSILGWLQLKLPVTVLLPLELLSQNVNVPVTLVLLHVVVVTIAVSMLYDSPPLNFCTYVLPAGPLVFRMT